MRRVIVTTLLTVFAGLAAAQECGYQGADFYSVPTTTLMIPQLAPAVPSLNGNKYWQIALCNPQPFAPCSATPAGNIIEINGAQTSCDTNFIAQSDNPTATWNFMYGGIHTIFYGKYSKANDRVANVTVYCDPSTPSIAAHGASVLMYSSPTDSSVWNFNIELKSTYACSGNPPPPNPTPNPPAPNTPSPPGPTPYTPPPQPTLPPASSIAVAAYSNVDCAGNLPSSVAQYNTCSVGSGAASNSSIMRFCDGSALRVWYFANATDCDGVPADAAEYQIGTCYSSLLDGTSHMVMSCQ
jgi:hypothetical protein